QQPRSEDYQHAEDTNEARARQAGDQGRSGGFGCHWSPRRYCVGWKKSSPAWGYDSRRAPKWRNWQTRRTQNPVPSGEWGFDSPLRHSVKSLQQGSFAIRDHLSLDVESVGVTAKVTANLANMPGAQGAHARFCRAGTAMLEGRAQARFHAMSKSSKHSADEESSTEKPRRASPHCLSVKPMQGSQVWLVRSAEELDALKRS